MSNTRKQLFTAVAMLLVAAVALGTATYAWFLNNAAANVETMQFQANTASSMEIALADMTTADANWTGDVPTFSTIGAVSATGYAGTPWQGLITNNNIKNMYGLTGDFNKLMPASSADLTKFFTVAGREAWDIKNQMATTFTAISAFTSSGATHITQGNDGNKDVIVLPLFLRADTNMNVYLQEIAGSDLISGGAIAGSLRVAVVPYEGAAVGSKVILERQDIKADDRRSTTQKIDFREGDAVKDSAPSFAAQDAKDVSAYLVKEGTGENAGFADPDIAKSKTALFKLDANVPKKVAVYIWMEGCDYDCVNSVSGQDFSINLNLIGAPIVTP